MANYQKFVFILENIIDNEMILSAVKTQITEDIFDKKVLEMAGDKTLEQFIEEKGADFELEADVALEFQKEIGFPVNKNASGGAPDGPPPDGPPPDGPPEINWDTISFQELVEMLGGFSEIMPDIIDSKKEALNYLYTIAPFDPNPSPEIVNSITFLERYMNPKYYDKDPESTAVKDVLKFVKYDFDVFIKFLDFNQGGKLYKYVSIPDFVIPTIIFYTFFHLEYKAEDIEAKQQSLLSLVYAITTGANIKDTTQMSMIYYYSVILTEFITHYSPSDRIFQNLPTDQTPPVLNEEVKALSDLVGESGFFTDISGIDFDQAFQSYKSSAYYSAIRKLASNELETNTLLKDELAGQQLERNQIKLTNAKEFISGKPKLVSFSELTEERDAIYGEIEKVTGDESLFSNPNTFGSYAGADLTNNELITFDAAYTNLTELMTAVETMEIGNIATLDETLDKFDNWYRSWNNHAIRVRKNHSSLVGRFAIYLHFREKEITSPTWSAASQKVSGYDFESYGGPTEYAEYFPIYDKVLRDFYDAYEEESNDVVRSMKNIIGYDTAKEDDKDTTEEDDQDAAKEDVEDAAKEDVEDAAKEDDKDNEIKAYIPIENRIELGYEESKEIWGKYKNNIEFMEENIQQQCAIYEHSIKCYEDTNKELEEHIKWLNTDIKAMNTSYKEQLKEDEEVITDIKKQHETEIKSNEAVEVKLKSELAAVKNSFNTTISSLNTTSTSPNASVPSFPKQEDNFLVGSIKNIKNFLSYIENFL